MTSSVDFDGPDVRSGLERRRWLSARARLRRSSNELREVRSSEQIAAMLPVLFPRDVRMRVSHETIYQSLFVQARGELKRELTSHLRGRRQRRKPQAGGAKRVTLGITNDIRISATPVQLQGDLVARPSWTAAGRRLGQEPTELAPIGCRWAA